MANDSNEVPTNVARGAASRSFMNRLLRFCVCFFVLTGLLMGIWFQSEVLESSQGLTQATLQHIQFLAGNVSSASLVDYVDTLLGSSIRSDDYEFFSDKQPDEKEGIRTTSSNIPKNSSMGKVFGSYYTPVHRRTVKDTLKQRIDLVQDYRKLLLGRTYMELNHTDAGTSYPWKVHTTGADSFTVDVTLNVHNVEDFILKAKGKSTARSWNHLQRGILPEERDDEEVGLVKEHLKLNFDAEQHYDPKTARKATAATANDDMNIVLFYADDWTLKVLGALNPHVKTPNIDEMGRNGMVFDYNSVTTSICWISRATLVTGVYAAVHKMVKIASRTMFNETVEWPLTLFSQLKSHGYYTGLVGKWHAPAPHEFMQNSFDVLKIYYGKHWIKTGTERRHVTDLNGEDALKFLKDRPKDQKFALKVGFYATHAWDHVDPPYQPMEASKALYVDDNIPMPTTATDQHWKDLPWFFTNKNEGRKRNRNRFDTPENYQRNIKDLYRMATEVDAVVGAVVQELKEQGVYDKTLLVFTTDNGNLHGEHGLAEKWYPWEESVRVPLVIQDPRMPASQRGKINHEFTLSIDLAPTLLRAAKIPVPSYMQGRDIAELYLNPVEATKNWRKDFFYEWTQGSFIDGSRHRHQWDIPAVFALIRRDYKYFYWPQMKFEQLFNVEHDPYEETDLLHNNSTTSAEVLNIMRARYAFMKGWAQAGNPV